MIVWRHVAAASVLCLFSFVAIRSEAYTNTIGYPAVSECPATAPSTNSNTYPAFPGHWRNPDRYGTGWDFFFAKSDSSLVAPDKIDVIWLTFDSQSHPAWLSNGGDTLQQSPTQYSAPLYRVTISTSGLQTNTPVGQVAISFLPGSTTQAALRWQLDDLGSSAQADECVYNLGKGTLPPGSGNTPIGESYTGLWYSPDSDPVTQQRNQVGWGLSVTVNTPTSGPTTETDTLEIFDVSGNPVWLLGTQNSPTAEAQSVNLVYSKSLYSGGYPTKVCKVAGCSLNTYTTAGVFTRSFGDDYLGNYGPYVGKMSYVSAYVPASFTGTGSMVNWSLEPANYPSTNIDLLKLTDDTSIVLVNQTSCVLPPGQSTCAVVVSWSSSDTSARVYRKNLVTNVLSSTALTASNTGQYTDNLAQGSDVQYEMHSGSSFGSLLFVSPEVKVVSQLGPATPPLPVLATAPTDDLVSDSVGASAGSFSVDQQGNANYSIPIYAPRGAGGLTPAISLTYNSGAGDGLVGYGWNIGGISSITPCRATQEHGDGPGVQRNIILDPARGAVFCLDGERMVLIQGPNGSQGAQYRLEHDDLSLIVVESTVTFGTAPNAYTYPNAFAVYAKDGTVRRYGTSAAQLSHVPSVNPQGVSIAGWYLYSLTDSNNNVIHFNYECASYNLSTSTILDSTSCPTNLDGTRPIAAIVPRSITWSGGEIDFSWVVRSTAIQTTNFLVGPVTQRYRVTGVTVKSSTGTTLRTYAANPVSGQTATGTALLQIANLKECVGTTCYSPTTFQWNNLNLTTGAQTTNSGSGAPFHNFSSNNIRFADIDGDGRQDVVWLDTLSGGNFHALLSQPSSTGIAFNTTDLCASSSNCPKNAKWGDSDSGFSWQLIDFDGDGRSDLLTLQTITGGFEWEVWLSNGAGFATRKQNILVPPGGNLSSPGAMPYTLDTSGHARAYVSDFDGDGLPDLFVIGDNGAVVYLLTPTGNASSPYVFQGPYAFATGVPNMRGGCTLGGFSANNLRIADFNGDGRADIVALTGSTPCATDTSLGYGPAPTITGLDKTQGDIGTVVTISGTSFSPAPAENIVQFNGATAVVSSASATQLQVIVPSGATTGQISVTLEAGTAVSQPIFTVTGLTGSGATSSVQHLQVMASKGIHDDQFFYFTAGYNWTLGASTTPPQPVNASYFQIIDLNGDGLADVVWGALNTTSTNNSAVWYYQINTGGGFSTATSCGFAGCAQQFGCVVSGCPQSFGASQVQVGDYNDDGKGDVWIPGPTAPNQYQVYQWNGNGFSSSYVTSPLYPSDTSPTPTRFGYQVDLDGDGYPETLVINSSDGTTTNDGRWTATRFGTQTRYQAGNVIGLITSGLGAVTNIDYSPLTFNSLYYRETNAPTLFSGWGAPVQDVMTPRYVVQYAYSSAPTASSPSNTSLVRYRYGGFKVQGYGRGSLGFHNVYTTDEQTNIETVTTYSQAFPLTGTPLQTLAFANVDTATDACLPPGPGPDSASCMAYNNPAPTFAGVTPISELYDIWKWHPRGTTSLYSAVSPGLLTSAVPIALQNTTSEAIKHGLDAGTVLSASLVVRAYDLVTSGNKTGESYGNVVSVTTSDFTSSSLQTALRSARTTNSYNDVIVAPGPSNNYQATWHLGRLATSYTTVTPYVNGVADTANAITRNSEFKYDPTTGQLTEEHLQPLVPTDSAPAGTSDQALDKFHFHDSWGNENETVTCSATATAAGACSPTNALTATSMTFRPTDQNWVQRYTRSDFSSTSGIYANYVYAPFWNGSGATEYRTLTVNSRDQFGNPTQTTDNLHGVVTTNAYGALGRLYFTATNTGAAERTIYRWCASHGGTNTVPCPAGAAYRVDVSTAADGTDLGKNRLPEVWSYFDVLARPMLKVQQGFAPTQFNAVSTSYDNLGRVAAVSEPYATTAPTSTSQAPGISTTQCGSTLYCTTTTYDILGRVLTATSPNNATTTTTYSGLDTTVRLPANGSGATQTKKQAVDLLGRVRTITDANNSTISNSYDATGNLVTVTRNGFDGRAATTQMYFDALGRKYQLVDPDAGTWSYAYNPLGEQVKKYNSSSTPVCTLTLFDGQGRQYSRADYANSSCTGTSDTTTSWTYDIAGNGLGQLAVSTTTDNASGTNAPVANETRNAYYDAFGRVRQVDTTLNGYSYSQLTTYDQFGRPFQSLFQGNGIPQSGELYVYNSQGYRFQVQDAENGYVGQIYHTVLGMDARGNVTQEERANNPALTTVRTYQPDMGWLTGISTGSPAGSTTNGAIESLGYSYDSIGNMMTRTDTSGLGPTGQSTIYEQMSYDALQELVTQQVGTSSAGPLTTQLNYAPYDSFGNPNSGTSLYGTYYTGSGALNCQNYGGVLPIGPDAPVGDSAGQNVRCYDGHGNVTTLLSVGNSPTVVRRKSIYSPYDAARTIYLNFGGTSTHTTTWNYGADRQRLVRQDYATGDGSGTPTVTHFVGNAEIDSATSSTRTVKRYISGLVLSQTVSGGTATNQYEYLYTDNLGSTHRIVDANGVQMSPSGAQWFTPNGTRASPTTGLFLDRASRFGFNGSLTHHGFTGHEQMDESAIAHMNGRIRDTNGTHFEQADPYVQDPTNILSLNRYAYVLNNPLTSTDPTGYWGRRQQGYLREAAAIAIALYSGVYYGAAVGAGTVSASEAAMGSIMSGYISGFTSSGNLKGAVLGAFDAGLNYGIGAANFDAFGRVAAHALEGGVMAELEGGRFGHGFITAGLTAAITPIDTGNRFTNGIEVSIIGGSISAAVGDKFANGAITAAFQYAFNELLHASARVLPKTVFVVYPDNTDLIGPLPAGQAEEYEAIVVTVANLSNAVSTSGDRLAITRFNHSTFEYSPLETPENGDRRADNTSTGYRDSGQYVSGVIKFYPGMLQAYVEGGYSRTNYNFYLGRSGPRVALFFAIHELGHGVLWPQPEGPENLWARETATNNWAYQFLQTNAPNVTGGTLECTSYCH